MQKIPLAISNRHLHLTAADYQILFGDEKISVRNNLSQPGQFAANQTVTLKTFKNILEKVRLIGPFRPYTQVEISQTDAYFLGLTPPIRMSGDLTNAAKITIVGPAGSIEREAAILAARHLHLTAADRQSLHLENISEITVRLDNLSPRSPIILSHVQLKEDSQAALELHLDTDEANAALARPSDFAEILNQGGFSF